MGVLTPLEAIIFYMSDTQDIIYYARALFCLVVILYRQILPLYFKVNQLYWFIKNDDVTWML